MCDVDRRADHRNRHGTAPEAHCQPLDDIGGRTHSGSQRDLPNWLHRGVVLRHVPDDGPGETAGQHGPERPGRDPHGPHRAERSGQEKHCAEPRGVPKCGRRPQRPEEPHRQNSDQRRRHANRGEHHGKRHEGSPQAFSGQRAGQFRKSRSGHGCRDGQRGDHRADEGLEDVGAHACHVSYVVSYVVCNHARITRVVFRNACLDFAYQVRSHIRGLGEDPASYPCEQGDGAGPHREPVQVDRVLGAGQYGRHKAHSDQAKACHG